MSSLIVEVSKIDNVIKHPNADRLSIATVKGWNVIIGLDEYKVGDLVVYIPPDSVLPDDLIEKYQLEYMRGKNRLRTIKLRGCVSQGLILPPKAGWVEGQDVAETLGITKYEPPKASYDLSNSGRKSTNQNPNTAFHKYTSIENIKNYNNVFQEGDPVVITEKIHGTNFRAGRVPAMPAKSWLGKLKRKLLDLFGILDEYEFVYGSHNVQLSYTGHKGWYESNVYAKIAHKYNLMDVPNGFVVYGEIYGKGIQDLEYGLDDIDLVVFDVKFEGEYISYDEMVTFCQLHGLPVAPLLYYGQYDPDILEELTNGDSILAKNNGKKQIREGCIVKALYEVNDIRCGRKILKSISPAYLMRKNGTEYH